MSQKTYKVIVKVSDDKFVKYHSHNLISFAQFLDNKFPNWRYMNVYHNDLQVASFTTKNRPNKKTL